MSVDADIFAFFGKQGLILFIGGVRVLCFCSFVPFLGGGVIPAQLRFALAMGASVFMYPCMASLSCPEWGGALFWLWAGGVLLKEILVGMVLAYTVSIIFWVMLSTGFLLDNQRGSSMGQTADPSSGESTSLFGAFLNQTAIYLFFSSGVFLQVLTLLLASYQISPPGFELSQAALTAIPLFLLEQFSRLMLSIVVFAAPIVLICLLADVSLGIVNRFAPQLNVFFLSMPIKSALGLGMIFLYLGTLLPLITKELFGISGHINAFWSLVRS